MRKSPQNPLKADLKAAPKAHLKANSLAFGLLGAAHAVVLVRSGATLPQALAQVFTSYAQTDQARGAIQDIAYRTMRNLGWADALLALMTKKQPEPPLLHALLCCALTLTGQSYNDFTVVDQAVTAASAHPGTTPAKGLVNAVLRRFLREQKQLMQQIMQSPSAATATWNYPAWWIEAIQAAYPNAWQTILETGNTLPPLVLRINRRKTTVSAYLDILAAHAISAQQIGPDAVRLQQPLPVMQIPGFIQGLASVQDLAAQLAAPLLDVQDGMRVLDACAAPGGKTCHILELANADVTALDCDAKRLMRVEENLQRLQLRATLKTGDARLSSPSLNKDGDWWDGQLFDRILADVPCTASGIVRRHPDIRWLRREGDAQQLAALSAQILDNLWQMLLPGGKLLLATCSIWPQESEMQAEAFAIRHQAIRLSAPGQLLPNIDGADAAGPDHDGLFYALFQKPAI